MRNLKFFSMTFMAVCLLCVSMHPAFAESRVRESPDPDWVYNNLASVSEEDANPMTHDYIPEKVLNNWIAFSENLENNIQVRVGSVQLTDTGMNVTFYLLGNPFEYAGNATYYNSTGGAMTVSFFESKGGKRIGEFTTSSLKFVDKVNSTEIKSNRKMPGYMRISDSCNREIFAQNIAEQNYNRAGYGGFEIKTIRPTETSVAVVMKSNSICACKEKPYLLYAKIYQRQGNDLTFYRNSILFETKSTEKGCAISPIISIASFKGKIEIINAVTNEVVATKGFR